MELHIEISGKTTKLDAFSLPAVKSGGTTRRQTSTGPVKRVKFMSGTRTLATINENRQTPLTSEDLIKDDLEIIFERAGRNLENENMSTVMLAPGSGRKPISDFELKEIITDAQGIVKETKDFETKLPNLNTNTPIKATRRYSEEKILSEFVFEGCIQMVQNDGLTHDMLCNLGADLQTKKECILVGSGLKGAGPLILRENGSPVRGFLFGRATPDGKHQILIMTTDTELKTPEGLDMTPDSNLNLTSNLTTTDHPEVKNPGKDQAIDQVSPLEIKTPVEVEKNQDKPSQDTELNQDSPKLNPGLTQKPVSKKKKVTEMIID